MYLGRLGAVLGEAKTLLFKALDGCAATCTKGPRAHEDRPRVAAR